MSEKIPFGGPVQAAMMPGQVNSCRGTRWPPSQVEPLAERNGE